MIISFNSNIYSELLTLQNRPLACGGSELLIVNSHCPITSHGAVTTYHTTPVNKMLYENVYWVSNFMITGIRLSSTSTEITQDKGLLFSAMSQKSRWVNNGSFNLDDFDSKQTSYFRIIFTRLQLWKLSLPGALSKSRHKIKKVLLRKIVTYFEKKFSYTPGWMLTKLKMKNVLCPLYFRMDADLVYLAHFPNPSVK